MRYWDNVRDLFCLNIPSNVEFLGISKLNIQFGKFEGDYFIAPGKDGIATLLRDDFSFNEFCEMTEEEKDEISLEYIESSLIRICERFDVPSDTRRLFKSAILKIRENGFEQIKIHKKTTKWHRSRKYRAITRIHFRKGGIDANLEFLDSNGVLIYSKKIIEARIWEVVWFDLWKGVWVDELSLIHI